MTDYRERIYRHYATARSSELAPKEIAGLSPRAPYLRRLIRRHFPQDRQAVILDLGCGHGALLYFLREAGYQRVFGVDRSPEQVAVAHRLGIHGVEQGELFATLKSLPDRSQDVVVCFDVIEHFRRDELIRFAEEVARVLRPGGRWVVHVPNGESPFAARMRYGDLTHELAFTRESLAQLCLSCGFSELSCYEDVPVVHGVTSALRFLMWKTIRACLRFYLAAETGDTGRMAIFSQNLLGVAIK